MTDQTNGFIEQSADAAVVYAANLLRYYSFELGGYTVEQLLSQWTIDYSINWVRMAIVEALYQGRYKAISVEQILAFWQRRGQPLHHFNHEFDRLVCNKFPRNLTPATYSSFTSVPTRSDTLRSLKAREIIREAQRSHRFLTAGDPPAQRENSEAQRTTMPALPPATPSPSRPLPPIEPPADPGSADADSTVVSQRLERLEMLKQMRPDPPPPPFNGHGSTTDVDQAAIATSSSNDAGDDRPLCNSHAFSSRLATITEHLQRLSYPLLKSEQDGFANLGWAISQAANRHASEQMAPYQPTWLSANEKKAPIHQFVPDLQGSDFHEKLKAVAHPPPDEPSAQACSAQ